MPRRHRDSGQRGGPLVRAGMTFIRWMGILEDMAAFVAIFSLFVLFNCLRMELRQEALRRQTAHDARASRCPTSELA